MDILEFRPLLIFFIEIFIAYVVFTRGKYYKNVIALFIITLAGYQLGEFIILKLPEYDIGYQLAFASTSLLPPFGIFMLEKVEKRFLGGLILFSVAIGFAMFLIYRPDSFELVEKCQCFAKFVPTRNSPTVIYLWGTYYTLTLTFGLFASGLFWLRIKDTKAKKRMHWLFLSYLLIFPFSYVITFLFRFDLAYITSIMCSLGIFGAYFSYRLSLEE